MLIYIICRDRLPSVYTICFVSEYLFGHGLIRVVQVVLLNYDLIW